MLITDLGKQRGADASQNTKLTGGAKLEVV
jgi:hypothetical protein